MVAQSRIGPCSGALIRQAFVAGHGRGRSCTRFGSLGAENISGAASETASSVGHVSRDIARLFDGWPCAHSLALPRGTLLTASKNREFGENAHAKPHQVPCAAGLPSLLAGAALGQKHGCGSADEEMFPTKTIVAECRELRGSHYAGRGREGGWSRRYTLSGKVLSRCLRPSTPPLMLYPPARSTRCSSPRTRDSLPQACSPTTWQERVTAEDLKGWVKKGHGTAEAQDGFGRQATWASMNRPNNIILKDENGGFANITIYDVMQSNGVIHSIDKVLTARIAEARSTAGDPVRSRGAATVASAGSAPAPW